MGRRKSRFQVCLVLITVSAVIFGSIVPVYAGDPRNNSGGVYDESEYQEVIFVTGEPVIVKGTIDARQSVKNGKGTVSLRFDLKNTDNDEDIKLTRNVTLGVTEETTKTQTVSTMEVKSFSETIKIGKNSYKLDDFQFTKSVITDNRPAADYFTGNWSGKKTYKFNSDDGTVEVFFRGDSIGYDNPWSATETQTISGTVSFEGDITVGKAVYSDDWSGTFDSEVTYGTGSKISYQPNDVQAISFPGGYVLIKEAESALSYKCRLPEFDKKGISEREDDSWDDTLSADSFPVYERLPVYDFKDMRGHWASNDAEILAGLGIMPSGRYFGPSIKMTRGEFARALTRALDLTAAETTASKTPTRTVSMPWGSRTGNKTSSQEESLFADVKESHPYYNDIKAVYDNGLLTGTGNGRFSPDKPLTRAQAVTAFIRALGFQNQGTAYASRTFRDQYKIPEWAQDSFDVANSIGLISGDSFGYVNPNQNLTRAEAASLLHRFIQYLQDDLRYEYRDRVLNY